MLAIDDGGPLVLVACAVALDVIFVDVLHFHATREHGLKLARIGVDFRPASTVASTTSTTTRITALLVFLRGGGGECLDESLRLRMRLGKGLRLGLEEPHQRGLLLIQQGLLLRQLLQAQALLLAVLQDGRRLPLLFLAAPLQLLLLPLQTSLRL